MEKLAETNEALVNDTSLKIWKFIIDYRLSGCYGIAKKRMMNPAEIPCKQ